MSPADMNRFATAFMDAWSPHKPIDKTILRRFYNLLKDVPIEWIEKALDYHALDPVRGRHAPLPADVMFQIKERMPKRPTADEAWLSIPRSEADSVIWTNEAAEAHYFVREELDPIAKRMGFRATYERIVARNEAEGKPWRYEFSLGWDKDQGRDLAKKGIDQGLIKMDQIPAGLLDCPGSIAGLLENHHQFNADKALENLCNLKKLLTRSDAPANS